ncbi:MAG: DUF1343 domain-containing protein [Bacteroidetes bacterium]|nr:DUF1343 domain-containing protein [Bacteroidota bacterium]
MIVKLKTFVAMVATTLAVIFACGQKNGTPPTVGRPAVEKPAQVSGQPVPAAHRMAEYLPILQGKKVAAVVNHTSMVGSTHLVDTLLKSGVKVVEIFAPEHGFRGTASDGEQVKDGKDAATGIPIASLYGEKKKPGSAELQGVDLVLFDIQDVGARFYTYISTMTYVMEACAENNIPLLLLDRPNPNGHYVDGPVLKKTHTSFTGLHEVPVVYGMTIGEYARMVNGEGWLTGGLKCQLEVVPCAGYDHRTAYQLPVKPSPNLPNMRAIYLYPSLCFFEGTVVSVGRGTGQQFQIYGVPGAVVGDFTFTPQPMEGAKTPPQQGKLCRGFNLTSLKAEDLRQRNSLNLSYLLDFYQKYPDKENFFLKTKHFDNLAGGTALKEQIIAGKTEAEIRQSWQDDLNKFKAMRKHYLLYYDFED